MKWYRKKLYECVLKDVQSDPDSKGFVVVSSSYASIAHEFFLFARDHGVELEPYAVVFDGSEDPVGFWYRTVNDQIIRIERGEQ